MMPSVQRSRANKLALVDEHGNTVGVFVTNDQPQFPVPKNDLQMKYPVPCSKLASVTIKWLQENFQENQYSSLPRNVMFEEYNSFCYVLDMKPFNQAVFGKIVRACFPNLKTRRLGVRGQSRYHYAGLGAKPTSCYMERFKAIQEKRDVMRAVNSLRKKKSGITKTIPRSQQPRGDSSKPKLQRTVTLDSLRLIVSSYPTAHDIDIRFGWSIDVLEDLIDFYRNFNQKLLGFITNLDLDKTLDHLRSFTSSVPTTCRNIMETTEVCYLLSLLDDIMYQKATASLLPNCLGTLTTEFNVSIRKYSKTLPLWISESCNDDTNINPYVFECRVNSARSWSDYVRRVTTLSHVTKEARKTLADPGIVIQLLRDLQNLPMDDTVEQCSYASCLQVGRDEQQILEKTSHEKEMTKGYVQEFIKLLERMDSVEKFAALLEEIVNENSGLLPEPEFTSSDDSFNVITKQTRLFLMKWSMYGSKMLTEITLRSSESVGAFHLVMLLFSDYVNHIICLRQERADRMKRKRDIIKRESPYLHSQRCKIQPRSFSAFTPVSASSSSGLHTAQFSQVRVKENRTLTSFHQAAVKQPRYFANYITAPSPQQTQPQYPKLLAPNQVMCRTEQHFNSRAYTTFYQPMPQNMPPVALYPNPSQIHSVSRYVNHPPNSSSVEPQQTSSDSSSFYIISDQQPKMSDPAGGSGEPFLKQL